MVSFIYKKKNQFFNLILLKGTDIELTSNYSTHLYAIKLSNFLVSTPNPSPTPFSVFFLILSSSFFLNGSHI